MISLPRRSSALACATVASVLALLSGAALHADEPVVWTNVVGASVSGNTLTKTGGAVAWDAGAASTNVIRDGYGYVEFTKTETSYRIMAGLSNGDSGLDYPDVDYAFHTDAVGNVHIFEAGTYRGQFGTYAAGDRFRIEVRYGVVRYLRNGTLLYTSTVQPRYPLRVDAELYDPGTAVTDVRVGNITWTSEVGISISGSTLAKSGASGWASGAITANTIEGADGAVEFTATETNTTRAAGLSNGDSSQDVADIDFAIKVRDDATVEVTEAGTSKGTFGSYAAADRFRVELTGGGRPVRAQRFGVLHEHRYAGVSPASRHRSLHSGGDPDRLDPGECRLDQRDRRLGKHGDADQDRGRWLECGCVHDADDRLR